MEKALLQECEELAMDALFCATSPLLMDGDGHFYAKNGNRIPMDEVLKEHQKMRVALSRIKDKLAVVQQMPAI